MRGSDLGIEVRKLGFGLVLREFVEDEHRDDLEVLVGDVEEGLEAGVGGSGEVRWDFEGRNFEKTKTRDFEKVRFRGSKSSP